MSDFLRTHIENLRYLLQQLKNVCKYLHATAHALSILATDVSRMPHPLSPLISNLILSIAKDVQDDYNRYSYAAFVVHDLIQQLLRLLEESR